MKNFTAISIHSNKYFMFFFLIYHLHNNRYFTFKILESYKTSSSFQNKKKISAMSSFMLLTSIQSTTTDKIFTNDRITTLLSDENEKFV